MHNKTIKRVLIYRLGSLGDTIVALPGLHLIAYMYPNAERRLLTNQPINVRAPAAWSVLQNSGLVHDYYEYPVGSRNPFVLSRLYFDLIRWRPQLIIYLMAIRKGLGFMRDAVFLNCIAPGHVVGVPWKKYQRVHQLDKKTGLYQSESSRLLQNIAKLGVIDFQRSEYRDLHLTKDEIGAANECLWNWPGRAQFWAFSLGTKNDVNVWGLDKWRELFSRLQSIANGIGIVMFGALDEKNISDQAGLNWPGPVLNLCGRISPRESAAVMRHAQLFLGQNSGPMHLAAAVGVPCVAVFSARDLPGVWFPLGQSHQILYHRWECAGCGLEKCLVHKKICIESITVDEVYNAVSIMIHKNQTKYICD